MNHSIARLLIPAVAIGLSTIAHAQSRSSFLSPDSISGVNVNKINSLDYKVSLGVGSTVTINGVTDQITDIFGFWALDDNDDLAATGTNSGVWGFDTNYSGTGGIVGFKTNPNTGITQGGSQTFHFDSISGSVEGYGVHIRLANSNTLYTTAIQTVPEPASLAALGLGVFGFVRRRRQSK